MHIYIDESGDTGYTKKSTRYFILTAVIVDDPFVLRRIAKSVYRSKVDKKKHNMLHSFRESDRVRLKLVHEIEGMEISCVAFVLDKKKIFEKDSYIYLLSKLIEYFLTLNHKSIVLAKIDTRKSYNNKIKEMFSKKGLNLILSDPAQEKSLQIADFYSWAIFTHLEYSQSVYFELLKKRITFR
jgi:hypothetical protein